MKKIVLYLLIGTFVLVCVNSAKASTIYVSGDGTRDYTEIQAAIDAASPGDIIRVAKGTYFENVVLKEGIELVGEGADLTVIDGGGYGHVVTAKYLSNVKIQGFTITNSGKEWSYVDGTVNSGIRILCSSVTLVQNIIRDNFIGIYVNSWGEWTDSSLVSIINNTIVDNTYAIWIVEASVEIINDIIVNNGVGIYDWSNFWGDSLFPLTIAYNDVWGNSRDYLSDSGRNNISADPMFVDADNGDYHLLDDSPCIDAGKDLGYPYNGSAPDLGAFESGSITPRDLIKQALIELDDIYPTGVKKADKKLLKAIESIERSLDNILWIDENHLNSELIMEEDDSDDGAKRYGEIVFNKNKKAVKHLRKIIKDKDTLLTIKGICQAVIDKILEADKLIANAAYDEAQNHAGDSNADYFLSKTVDELDKAELDVNNNKKQDKSISHYKKAWKHSQQILNPVHKDDDDFEEDD